MKILDYLCNSKSEISNAYNAVEGDCLQAMKIVHYHANGYFDWLISGQQSDTPLREAVSILSGKYKRFSFVHPLGRVQNFPVCFSACTLCSFGTDLHMFIQWVWVFTV